MTILIIVYIPMVLLTWPGMISVSAGGHKVHVADVLVGFIGALIWFIILPVRLINKIFFSE